MSAGGGFDFSKFLSISFSAEAERRTVQQYGGDEVVQRRYYKRQKTSGDYVWTKVKKCDGDDQGKVTHFVSYPEPDEIIIDENWAKAYPNLETDAKTGEVKIRCYADYDRYVDALVDSGLPREDTPYFVSLTARWKTEPDFRTCFEPEKEVQN